VIVIVIVIVVWVMGHGVVKAWTCGPGQTGQSSKYTNTKR
jgi:hypothetical protein